MRAIKLLVAKPILGGLASALLLAACARPVDMSVASIHQKLPEFDFMVYRDGWACLSDGAAGSSCAPSSGRQLRELFSQRSRSRSLRDYLTQNGASCRASDTLTTCSYTKALSESAYVFGRPAAPPEAIELAVSFPTKDINLAPEQITTAMKRFTRVP